MHKWVLNSSAVLLKAFHNSFTDIQNRDGESTSEISGPVWGLAKQFGKGLLHEEWGLAGPPQYGRTVDQTI